jgi:hypothetical protein
LKPALHHENANATSLGVVRAGVFALWLYVFLTRWPHGIELPAELFVARGVGLLVPETVLSLLLSPGFTAFFPWVFVPVVLAAALGLRPFRLWAVLAVVLLVMFDCRAKGFSGFVYHSMVLPLATTGVLACAPAADGFVVQRSKAAAVKPDSVYRFPLLVMLTAGLFCYTFMAVHRLVNGDYAVFNGEALHAWLLVRSQEPASTGFVLGTAVANSPVMFALYKAGFLVTTVLELLSLLCLYSRRFALVWLVYFLVFHVLSLLTLNIFFWENSLMLPLLMLPLGAWIGVRRDVPARSAA